MRLVCGVLVILLAEGAWVISVASQIDIGWACLVSLDFDPAYPFSPQFTITEHYSVTDLDKIAGHMRADGCTRLAETFSSPA